MPEEPIRRAGALSVRLGSAAVLRLLGRCGREVFPRGDLGLARGDRDAAGPALKEQRLAGVTPLSWVSLARCG